MKHTAVEQLQVNLSILLGRDIMRMLFNEFEQAKEIEKEQIVEAHGNKLKKSKDEGNYEYWFSGEDYYNKTFKNTKQ